MTTKTKTKTKTIIVYSDPGHGWGKASRLELVKLGILEKISGYSYQRKEWVYLEEDCDMSLYIDTLKNCGFEVKFNNHLTNLQSRIRSFDSFEINQIDLSVIALLPSWSPIRRAI